MGFLNVGQLTLWTDTGDGHCCRFVDGQRRTTLPFLLQSCRRALSSVDLTEVQSYELKHWISFV